MMDFCTFIRLTIFFTFVPSYGNTYSLCLTALNTPNCLNAAVVQQVSGPIVMSHRKEQKSKHSNIRVGDLF